VPKQQPCILKIIRNLPQCGHNRYLKSLRVKVGGTHLYSVFHLKRSPFIHTASGNTEFLLPYQGVSADGLLEVGNGCSIVCSVVRYALSQTLHLSRNIISLCIWNKLCFAREYTLFAPAQLLRKWREQRPSNQGYPDSCRGRGWGWSSV
jgi:hypothetical protein